MTDGKILVAKDGKQFFVRDTLKDYHCQFGLVKKEELQKEDGLAVSTNTGMQLRIFSPQFSDVYARIKRSPQIIPRKDVAAIIAETGVGKDSVVVDAGAGSGALACFLARIAKKVVSYEIRDDFLAIAMENAQRLQLKNLTVKKGDVCKDIAEKNVDVMTLDIPNPWDAVDAASKALKPGGFLVSYSPTIAQVVDMVERIGGSSAFLYLRTLEIIERDWEVSGRKTRPKSQQIGHSGFLVFARKLS